MSQEPKEPKIKEEQHIRCNFCGKDAAAVFLLITGPSVNICDECVIQSMGIIMRDVVKRETRLTKVVSFDQKEDNDE